MLLEKKEHIWPQIEKEVGKDTKYNILDAEGDYWKSMIYKSSFLIVKMRKG